MKTSIVLRVVAAFFSAAMAAEYEAQENAVPSTLIPSEVSPSLPMITSMPELIGDDDHGTLELRQATAINNAATAAALQYPSITTNWVQTTIGGAVTYVPIVYTQTFAAVPDQWAGPIAGSIGYGTLTKNKGKRDLPEPTVQVIPVEMVLQTRHIIEPIQPVLPVQVVQPLTITSISIVFAPTYSSSNILGAAVDNSTAIEAPLQTLSAASTMSAPSMDTTRSLTTAAFVPSALTSQQSSAGKVYTSLSFQPFWYNSSRYSFGTASTGFFPGSTGMSRLSASITGTRYGNASAPFTQLWSSTGSIFAKGYNNNTNLP